MSGNFHNQYVDDLRGNREIFLFDILHSPEFQTIRKKHLEHIYIGIDMLLKRVIDENHESGQRILACADEISQTFKISNEHALDLILTPNNSIGAKLRYLPRVSREGDEIIIRIGQKTTQADVEAAWKHVKSLQKELGGSGSKSSINPELAFCIHKQYVLKNRKMSEIFMDYTHGKLEGYEHVPTIMFEDDFRKYYKRVVKGL